MKGSFVRVMLVLIFLALIANLVFTALRGDSFIKVGSIRILAFWALVAADLIIAGTGVFFASRALQKSDRSALKWGRRAFVTAGICVLVLGLHPWLLRRSQVTLAEDMEDTMLSLVLLGATAAVFAYAFYRDYLRATASRDSHRRRRGSARRAHPPGPLDDSEE